MTTARASANGALTFPEGFAWGTATASYQIEGAVSADGRGLSVWDTFSRAPGKVHGGDTGDIACDSYHRYREDVALMASLGLNAYRFSISWPRILPGGRGAVNQKGLDYYKALLDELGGRGIAAAATLFHWDLPQELQDEGGWAVRDTAARFADYAAVVAEALGDRVERWITLNEPQVVASHGYRTGEHAPGVRDPDAARAATHHLLLGHGLAAQALRAALPRAVPVGITLDMHPVRLPGGSVSDAVEQASRIRDAENEPPLPGAGAARAVPGAGQGRAAAAGLGGSPGRPGGHRAAASTSSGSTTTRRCYLRAGDPADLRRGEKKVAGGDLPGVVEYAPAGLERTPMGWLVDPEGLYELLVGLSKDAPGLPLYITENGCAAEDYVNPNGEVNDLERVRYLHLHLEAAARAIRDGANLAGYYLWSLLDNFEWGYGYQKRFGIVFVDFGTQRRIPKASARFYADVVRANAIPALPALT